jgi:hypothetical protein
VPEADVPVVAVASGKGGVVRDALAADGQRPDLN